MSSNNMDKREALKKYRHLLTRDKTPPEEPEAAPTTAAVISKAPVLYNKPEQPVAPKPKDASLQFIPRNVSRPNQAKTQRPVTNKAIAAMTAAAPQGSEKKRLTYEEWKEVGITKPTEDGYLFDNRPVNSYRGGYNNRYNNVNRKKKKQPEEAPVRDWNAIYDPDKPNSYHEYHDSDVHWRVRHNWKKHVQSWFKRGQVASDAVDAKAQDSGPTDEAPTPPIAQPSPATQSEPPRPAAAPTSMPTELTGEEAYARRMAMSRGVQPAQRSAAPTQPSQAPTQAPVQKSPQPHTQAPTPTSVQPPPQSLTHSTGAKKVIFAPPVMYGPVPPPTSSAQPSTDAQSADSFAEEPSNAALAQPGDDEEQAPRPKRPSRKDWSKKLLMKTGWSEGTGLGAQGQGIVEPLALQINKRRKRNEEDGGGYVGSTIIGKITGGTRSKEAEAAAAEELAKGPGELSRVIVLEGLTRGMDLEQEMESGNLINRIGEECGKNGLERIQVDWQSEDPAGAPIFVQYNNEMAALKALQDLKGRDFNGIKIDAKFFDAVKFEAGMLS